MIIEITKKGIKETLGSEKRFQNLPRKLKELKIATIRSLPELIRNANLIRDNVLNTDITEKNSQLLSPSELGL